MAKKIIVVDDDPDIVEAIKIILEDENYEVITSHNGKILDSLSPNNLPNLIVLDILLSGIDGRDLCKKLKDNEMTKSIPVILISAHVDAKKTTISCGADGFIAKPFDVDDFLATIKKYIS